MLVVVVLAGMIVGATLLAILLVTIVDAIIQHQIEKDLRDGIKPDYDVRSK